MVISDGIEGENVAEEIFKELNPNRTVRAFSFYVGRTHVNVGRTALLRMACDNRGYFYVVETVGNIWDTVLHYLQVRSFYFLCILPVVCLIEFDIMMEYYL